MERVLTYVECSDWFVFDVTWLEVVGAVKVGIAFCITPHSIDASDAFDA